MTVSTDVIRRVWDDKEGVALSVGPDADALGLVTIGNLDKKSEEYWGKVNITMEHYIARALGIALIAAADEAEKVQ